MIKIIERLTSLAIEHFSTKLIRLSEYIYMSIISLTFDLLPIFKADLDF